MAATDDVATIMALRMMGNIRYKTSAGSWQEYGDADVIALGDVGTGVSLTPGVNRQASYAWTNISTTGNRISHYIRRAINDLINQYLGRPDLFNKYIALDDASDFSTINTAAQTTCVIA